MGSTAEWRRQEKIGESEDRKIEITQFEQQRENRLGRKIIIRDVWENEDLTFLSLENQKERREECGIGEVFEEIMPMNS